MKDKFDLEAYASLNDCVCHGSAKIRKYLNMEGK